MSGARLKRGKSTANLGAAEHTNSPAKKSKNGDNVSTAAGQFGDNVAFSTQPQYLIKLSEVFE